METDSLWSRELIKQNNAMHTWKQKQIHANLNSFVWKKRNHWLGVSLWWYNFCCFVGGGDESDNRCTRTSPEIHFTFFYFNFVVLWILTPWLPKYTCMYVRLNEFGVRINEWNEHTIPATANVYVLKNRGMAVMVADWWQKAYIVYICSTMWTCLHVLQGSLTH